MIQYFIPINHHKKLKFTNFDYNSKLKVIFENFDEQRSMQNSEILCKICKFCDSLSVASIEKQAKKVCKESHHYILNCMGLYQYLEFKNIFLALTGFIFLQPLHGIWKFCNSGKYNFIWKSVFLEKFCGRQLWSFIDWRTLCLNFGLLLNSFQSLFQNLANLMLISLVPMMNLLLKIISL